MTVHSMKYRGFVSAIAALLLAGISYACYATSMWCDQALLFLFPWLVVASLPWSTLLHPMRDWLPIEDTFYLLAHLILFLGLAINMFLVYSAAVRHRRHLKKITCALGMLVVLLVCLRILCLCPIEGYWSCPSYQCRLMYELRDGEILEYTSAKEPLSRSVYCNAGRNLWALVPTKPEERLSGEPLRMRVGWFYMKLIDPDPAVGEVWGTRELNLFEIVRIKRGRHPWQASAEAMRNLKLNAEPAGGAYVSPAAGDPSAHP